MGWDELLWVDALLPAPVNTDQEKNRWMGTNDNGKTPIDIGFMNRSSVQTTVLTVTFSLCLCLIGPVGSEQNDPLSLWLVQHTTVDSVGQISIPSKTMTDTGIRLSSVIFILFEWALCLLSGMAGIVLFTKLPIRWCLTLSGILMAMILGVSFFFWKTANVLVTSSVPILSLGFGVLTAWILQGAAINPSRFSFKHPAAVRDRVAKGSASKPTLPAEPLDAAASFFNPSAPETNSATNPINEQSAERELTIGRYEIIRSIGKGAMGEVFLGRDPHINRLTAVKTVRFEENFADDDIEQIKIKFFREAESAGTLSHPHIVTIYDAGEDGDSAYIAMEFLEGSTLLRFARRKRLLPLRRLIRYMAQVAEALDYAHTQGVTHRDIKPANIMLIHANQIKITDFGIAHLATSSQTQTGVVKGTPYYMSPEQFSGQKVDGRSDIFSLGTTMFQLLTGTLPFYAESPALLMNQIMNFPHPNPRAINPRVIPAIVGILDKALEKDRDNRYQTAKDLARDLSRLDKRIMTVLRKDRTVIRSG
jgi:tRNA A-37 threonylcarbamoyl transferase component Bud32